MNTIITKDFQIKLIAFGLLAIIPITINLGLSFLFPKTDWNTYRTLETEYIKNNMPNYDQYKKLKRDYNLSKKESNLFSVHKEYVKKWQESQQYKNLKETDKQHDQYRFITLCFLIIALISTLIFIPIPIIHAAIIYATLFLFIFTLNYFSPEISDSFVFMPLAVLRILTSLICLLITLHIVYKNND